MIELKEHNKKPYERLEKALQEHNQAIYVSGVGTGKSFVFMKLLADSNAFKDKKCLYIIPQESIGVNLMNYSEYKVIKDRVTFMNMQQFSSSKKAKELLSGYDLVVCDEAHHLASDIYGKHIMEAVIESNIPFLGLTATPVRMDGIDIRNDFAAVVDGISNFDAIRLGLMPQFTYRIGVPDKDLSSYRERIYKESQNIRKRQGVIRDFSMSKDVIKEIAFSYPRNKYIVFSGDIESLHRDNKVIAYAFPDKPIYELYTGSGDTKAILEEFNTAESGVLMTVDMALEGIHLDNVDGIILFRNVQSIPVFEQMLGRVCSIGKKVSPVVIDCSARGIDLLQKLLMDNDARWNDVNIETRIELEELYLRLKEEEEMSSDTPNESVASKEIHEFKTERGVAVEVIPRDIFHIALGAHEEWKSIDEFERAWAECNPAKHKDVRASRAQAAAAMWENSKAAYSGLSDEMLYKCMTVIAAKYKTTVTEMQEFVDEREADDIDLGLD